MNDSSTNSDRVQIEKIMQDYIEGARTGSSDVLRPIFHDMATVCGYVGPDLFAESVEKFYDWHDENGAAASVKAGDLHIDIEGTAATARFELDNWTGHRFTDFFTLVKIDGRWQIMSKVFYLHPE